MSENDAEPRKRTFRLGVDIGGTFTDIILLGADASVFQIKIPSTPPNFGQAVVQGVQHILAQEDLKIESTDVSVVLHGTTVATNAILEHHGAKTGLLTTRGFRDVLELGRMRHPSLYDIFWDKPAPLVPRYMRQELDERVNARGEVETAADLAQAKAAAEKLISLGVQSLAICFLNSYINPVHEKQVLETLRARFPKLYISASFEILPEIKEYERTSTTVVNAFVQPIVDQYVAELENDLEHLDVRCPILIMQSNGGLIHSTIARSKPVQLIESGPAAGVIAAQFLARELGVGNLIAFDMGGTTAKASLIQSGEPFVAQEYEVGGGMNTKRSLMKGGGYTIHVPSIDIAEVGAGGGSLFWIDAGGAPHVGPQSAGALPGPACYGRGGTQATITDAAVVLGYLNSHSLAGGAQPIDGRRAVDVIRAQAAEPLGISLPEAAYGIYTIANSTMTGAIKAVSSERGRDPRDFALMAFGGAGPVHAVELAREFEISTVIIPISPGLFSTIGLLVADIQYHDVVSYTKRSEIDLDQLNSAYSIMEERLQSTPQRQNLNGAVPIIERFVDLRYVGQSHELRIPVTLGTLDHATLADVRRGFDDEYERTYGYRAPDQHVEIVNLRTRATFPNPDRRQVFDNTSPEFRSDAVELTREAYFGPRHGLVQTPVLPRRNLSAEPRPGPLIIEDMDATTVIPPGSMAARDRFGNIVIQVGK
jgi:N-methylhydantoinase A